MFEEAQTAYDSAASVHALVLPYDSLQKLAELDDPHEHELAKARLDAFLRAYYATATALHAVDYETAEAVRPAVDEAQLHAALKQRRREHTQAQQQPPSSPQLSHTAATNAGLAVLLGTSGDSGKRRRKRSRPTRGASPPDMDVDDMPLMLRGSGSGSSGGDDAVEDAQERARRQTRRRCEDDVRTHLKCAQARQLCDSTPSVYSVHGNERLLAMLIREIYMPLRLAGRYSGALVNRVLHVFGPEGSGRSSTVRAFASSLGVRHYTVDMLATNRGALCGLLDDAARHASGAIVYFDGCQQLLCKSECDVVYEQAYNEMLFHITRTDYLGGNNNVWLVLGTDYEPRSLRDGAANWVQRNTVSTLPPNYSARRAFVMEHVLRLLHESGVGVAATENAVLLEAVCDGVGKMRMYTFGALLQLVRRTVSGAICSASLATGSAAPDAASVCAAFARSFVMPLHKNDRTLTREWVTALAEMDRYGT